MSYWKNRHRYNQLISNFLDSKINGEEFRIEFFRMMRKDQDTHSVFQHECKEEKLESMLSRVFTACDVFNPDSNHRTEYEYNETELRGFVHDIMAENDVFFK